MEIRSRLDFPAGVLTNFAPHAFKIDGIECSSMEGFLQSLKADDLKVQIDICQLVGIEAKNWGNENNVIWKETQCLWWRGQRYDRHGQEYQELLDRAYAELFKNENFKQALLATGEEILTHSIGKNDPYETILTEEEFCSRLMNLRARI